MFIRGRGVSRIEPSSGELFVDERGDGAVAAMKTMRLRYAGRCRTCNRELAAGTMAVYDRESKTVACQDCPVQPQSAQVVAGVQVELVDGRIVVAEDATSADQHIFAGTAGASARRENERRKNAREARIRAAHPRIGGFILATSDDPQSTKAWATGAVGEELLGKQLDCLIGYGVHLLHDRRILPGKGNIDHIAVCASGVFVIDAKRYRARPSLRVEGGWFGRPRVEKLMVGSRDCSSLVGGVQKQLDRVTSALVAANLGGIPVSGMLCFVEADWPLIGGDFNIAGLRVLWPKKALGLLAQPGELDAARALSVYRALAAAFPMA